MNVFDRIKDVWKALPSDLKRRVEPTLALDHHVARPVGNAVLGRPKSKPVERCVDKAGNIVGDGQYEEFDPGWALAGVEWLGSLLIEKHLFNSSPAIVRIPDDVQIAIAGDWGTGNWRGKENPAPSTRVQERMSFLRPQITIHLGDVYYAGTADEEKVSLLSVWPRGSLGTHALNSNHEMYNGGRGYFNVLAQPAFELQRGCSYFALENTNWVIVGLDSAYYADEPGLYLDGTLSVDQSEFLSDQGSKGKRLIVMTHHNGFSQDGDQANGLWQQVLGAAGPSLAYWYWGHVHAGVVYQSQENVLARCCGHGGLPFGSASEMIGTEKTVEWYENRPANDTSIPERVLNGFAMLYLSGDELEEVFYDENGGVAWASKSQ